MNSHIGDQVVKSKILGHGEEMLIHHKSIVNTNS